MVGAVDERHLHVDQGIAREDAGTPAPPPSPARTERMYSRGMDPPTISSSNSNPLRAQSARC